MLKSLQEAESLLHYSELELHPYPVSGSGDADDVLESDRSDFAAFGRDATEEEPVTSAAVVASCLSSVVVQHRWRAGICNFKLRRTPFAPF